MGAGSQGSSCPRCLSMPIWRHPHALMRAASPLQLRYLHQRNPVNKAVRNMHLKNLVLFLPTDALAQRLEPDEHHGK